VISRHPITEAHTKTPAQEVVACKCLTNFSWLRSHTFLCAHCSLCIHIRCSQAAAMALSKGYRTRMPSIGVRTLGSESLERNYFVHIFVHKSSYTLYTYLYINLYCEQLHSRFIFVLCDAIGRESKSRGGAQKFLLSAKPLVSKASLGAYSAHCPLTPA
jgi:hypothetical protein